MTSAAAIPTVTLNDENTMPVIGLGVGELSDSETEQAVSAALEAGYRLIDTAAAYGNEAAVGRAIAASGIPREELFVTTKLATADQGFQSSQDALRGQPGAARPGLRRPLPDPLAGRRARQVRRQLGRADEARRRTATPGRSAWPTSTPSTCRTIIDLSFFTPAVNQIELHPLLNQAELRAVNAEHGIVTEAYGPLGVGRLLDNPTIDVGGPGARQDARAGADPVEHPARQRRHPALRVTRSGSKSNIDVFDFELTDDEMATLNGLDDGTRFRPDPETYTGT